MHGLLSFKSVMRSIVVLNLTEILNTKVYRFRLNLKKKKIVVSYATLFFMSTYIILTNEQH